MKKLSFILALILILTICPTASAVEIPDGAYGVIWIPYLHIKMPIYTADIPYEQDVIDEEESALYYHWQSAYRIVDHAFSNGLNGKGEWDIQKVFAGAYAYLYTINGNYYYECYLTAKTDYRGDQEFYNNRLITPCSSYDIMLSCCAENTHRHFVAVFRRLKEY